MYSLETPLITVTGIGQATADLLAKQGFETVRDLLLFVPLRYEDRSHFTAIADIPENQVVTIKAEVNSTRTYYKGGKSIHTAVVHDESGKLTLMWFNNRYIFHSVKQGNQYYFSGKLGHNRVMLQPTAERADGPGETIHTNRLVPIYSSTTRVKQGLLRRYLHRILTDLKLPADPTDQTIAELSQIKLTRLQTFNQIHFPDDEAGIIQARERLALEELIGLIRYSRQIKERWKQLADAPKLNPPQPLIPDSIPFALTQSQQRSYDEILKDLQSKTPMNRLLIGDVGSGKTVVAGLAMRAATANQNHACLVAPTQILAEQHAQTLIKLFPKQQVVLITGKGIHLWQDEGWVKTASAVKQKEAFSHSSFIVGTHAVLNHLAKGSFSPVSQDKKSQVGLIVFDEQHRFGVSQRSLIAKLSLQPHILTMTATPIPRSLMLTIFSHLSLSLIDELPKNRIPTKTWLLPGSKRERMFAWLQEQIDSGKKKGEAFQILLVCPFIDPSQSEALENVAAAKEKYEEISSYFSPHGSRVGLLHGRLKAKEKDQVIADLYQNQIDILVTTPIVEVGIDLPQAAAMVIEAAERFGLASLHQLRGRVGRAGQQGYCLLFTSSHQSESKERLKVFEKTHDGRTLAELDLKQRGAGDIFGTKQHGFDKLKFASWTNLELIAQAKSLADTLPAEWKPIVEPSQSQDQEVLAN
jgi:ATP-dependent DNA helicase RecG